MLASWTPASSRGSRQECLTFQVVKSRRDANALDPCLFKRVKTGDGDAYVKKCGVAPPGCALDPSGSAGAVGSLQTDKADLRIQELDCLFKERC
eukprot:gene5763-6060_t